MHIIILKAFQKGLTFFFVKLPSFFREQFCRSVLMTNIFFNFFPSSLCKISSANSGKLFGGDLKDSSLIVGGITWKGKSPCIAREFLWYYNWPTKMPKMIQYCNSKKAANLSGWGKSCYFSLFSFPIVFAFEKIPWKKVFFPCSISSKLFAKPKGNFVKSFLCSNHWIFICPFYSVTRSQENFNIKTISGPTTDSCQVDGFFVCQTFWRGAHNV